MQFLTIRERRSGTEKWLRQYGGRGEFFTFYYELVHDPTIEGVGVQLNPAIKTYASWDSEPDIHTGTRIGWEDAKFDDAARVCCTKLHILTTRDHPVDTSPLVIRSLLIEFVRKRLTASTEPLPLLHKDWLTSDVIALARGIHSSAAFDGLPALYDALLEVGCDDPLVMEHLQTCPDHAPSCWVTEMIVDQAASRS
jgi:hypothetical protein